MARVTIYQGLDMTTAWVQPGWVEFTSPIQIVTSWEETDFLFLSGLFVYPPGGTVRGLIRFAEQFRADELLYTLEDIDIEAGSAWAAIGDGDMRAVIDMTFSGDDRFEGSSEDDALIAGAGDDILLGGAGDDRLFGELGADRLFGGSGADRLEGGDGRDLLEGGDGADRLVGGSGNDVLDGGAGTDTLVLEFGLGRDVYIGGADRDLLLFNASALDPAVYSVEVNLDEGRHTVIWTDGSEERSVTEIEDYRLTGAVDVSIIATSAANSVRTGSGDDRVATGAGDDGIFTGAGSDHLSGGEGSDRLNGGAGADRLLGQGGNDRLQAGGGNDRADGGDGADLIFGGDGQDALYGRRGRDVLFGDDRTVGYHESSDRFDDILFGGGGNDTVQGGRGDDMLHGGTGDDVLHGGYGDDILDGAGGNDILIGYYGDNILTGGGGADRFVFGAPNGGNNGTITDFDAVLDILELHVEPGREVTFYRNNNDTLIFHGSGIVTIEDQSLFRRDVNLEIIVDDLASGGGLEG